MEKKFWNVTRAGLRYKIKAFVKITKINIQTGNNPLLKDFINSLH